MFYTFFLLLVLGILGNFLCLKIIIEKSKSQPILCPITKSTNCDAVLRSRYNALLLIPNEKIGFVYYDLVTIYAFLRLIAVESAIVWYIGVLVGVLTVCAVIFSVMLVYIQAYILKKWCVYCLMHFGILVTLTSIWYISGEYRVLVTLFLNYIS